jgi:hypothetical protein
MAMQYFAPLPAGDPTDQATAERAKAAEDRPIRDQGVQHALESFRPPKY